MATPNIVPRADSEGQLGTSSKYWGAAYIDFVYVGAGKVGRDADNLLDFSTDNVITFRLNGGNELALDANQLYPSTNDGLALGYVDNGFSDLFLATGAVINFGGNNVTLTHSSGRLTLADSDKLVFGTGLDLQINHDATNSYVENFNGNLYIDNHHNDGDIIFRSDDGSGGVETYFYLDGSNNFSQSLKHIRFADNASVLVGSSSDLSITHDGTNSVIANSTGDLQINQNTNDGDIIFKSDDGSGGTTPYITIDGSAARTVFSQHTEHGDSKKAFFGNSLDLAIYHDGSSSYIENGDGNMFIMQRANDADLVFQADNGAGADATYFYLDGSSAAHDGSATTALYTNWPDNSYISLGTSHDLQIVHTGVNSVIQNLVGKLQILSFTDDIEIKQFGDDKDIILSSDDGSGGVTPYLTLDGSAANMKVAKDMRFNDSVDAEFGTSGDFKIYHDGSNTYLEQINDGTGNIVMSNANDDGDIIFQSDDGSGGTTAYLTLDGSAGHTRIYKNTVYEDSVQARFGNGEDFKITHDGSNSSLTNETGDLTISNNADNRDIIFQSDDGSGGVETYFFLDGSASSGPFTAFPDSSKLAFGDGRDLQIQHDGTNSTIQNNTGNLIIANDTGVTITGASGSTDGKIVIKPVSGGREYQLKNVGSDFRIHDASADVVRMHFDNDGNTGIGTTTPASALHVAGTFQVGVDDTGHDVRFYGAASGRYMEWDESENALKFTDFSRIKIGTGSDLEIYHDGSHSYMQNGTGDLIIKNTTHAGDIIFQTESSGGTLATYFQLDGGITKTTFSKDTKHFDSVKGIFGTNDDLQIYHDGSDSYIKDAGTGNLKVMANNLYLQNATGESYISCLSDDRVEIFHNNVKKFETTAAGATFTGALTVDETTTNNLNIASFKHQQAAVISEVLLENAAGADNTGVSLNFKTAASGYGGKVTVLRTNSPSAGSADMILSSSGSEALRLDSSQNATFAGTITSTSATGTAEGSGIDATDAVNISVGEINGEIITTINVDIGKGSIISSSTAGDVIGNDGLSSAYITRLTTAINGIVYKGEMICVEVPTTGDPDINLTANTSGTIAEDQGGEGAHVLVNGGVATLAAKNDITIPSGGIVDDYLYLTHGGTTAGTYDAGQFIIKLYGAATL